MVVSTTGAVTGPIMTDVKRLVGFDDEGGKL